MKILFKNAKILDLDKACLEYGAVEVVDEIISRVGDFEWAQDYDRVINCKSNILMPGFVNTHCHTPMSLLRSINDDAPLDEWLFDNVLPAEGRLTPNDVYWGEYLGILEGVRAGITTIEEGYFHNDQVNRVVHESGIRARIGIGPAIQDNGISNVEYLEKCSKQIQNNNLVDTSCFVHAIYTTSEKAIRESVEFANKNNISLSIHLAETEKEVMDCISKTNKTPVQYLDSLGFFESNCLCYHSVHVTDDDMNILKNKSVSVATCPSSNLKLGSGIAPILEMHQRGINLTIGTDGVASNNSLDMFKEMFLVANLYKVKSGKTAGLRAIDILRMATINGAKALGVNSGEIKPNKNADLILIDINQPHYYPQENLISHLVYSGKSSDVYLTMVGGKVVYEESQYNIGQQPSAIYENANKIRRRIMD